MKEIIYILASRGEFKGEMLTDIHTEHGYFTNKGECQDLANAKNKETENNVERTIYFVRTVSPKK